METFLIIVAGFMVIGVAIGIIAPLLERRRKLLTLIARLKRYENLKRKVTK